MDEALGMGAPAVDRWKKTVRMALLLVFMMAVTCPGIASQPLQMAFIDTDAVPFKWTVNGKRTGPIIDIMAEVSRRAEVEVTLVPLPARRIDAYLEAGAIGGAFGLSRKASRSKVALFLNPPIGLLDAHLFVIRGKEFHFTKIEDLYGKKVGLVRGLVFGPAFDAGVRAGKITVEAAPAYDSLLKMLLLRRVDAAASPAPVLYNHIERMGLSDSVMALPHPLRPDFGLYVVVSRAATIPKKQELIRRMETALADMAREGVFDRIYGHYGYAYRSEH